MASNLKDPYKNFCVHPFVKMFVSTEAQMRPCCISKPVTKQNTNVRFQSIESVWNGEDFQQLRQSFNQRQIPEHTCRACIENEKNGFFSHRQYENKKWKSLTDFYFTNPHTIVPPPVSFDLRLSNECNLQCVMCNPELSNQIAKNMSKYNKSNKANPYTLEYDVEKYVVSDSGLNQKFIDHIITNADNTQEIWTLGGEPFVMKPVLSLLETLVENKQSNHISLKMISNGTVIKESWIEKYLTKFEKVWIGISLDATEDILEYVRYPSSWSVLQQKIISLKKICDRYPNFSVTLEPTIQLLNLKSLPKLFTFANENNFIINPSFLDEPIPLFFGNSTQQYRMDIISQLESSNKHFPNNSLLKDGWLDWVKNQPQKFLDEKEKVYFVHMIEYFDKTRPVRFLELYPEFEFMLD